MKFKYVIFYFMYCLCINVTSSHSPVRKSLFLRLLSIFLAKFKLNLAKKFDGKHKKSDFLTAQKVCRWIWWFTFCAIKYKMKNPYFCNKQSKMSTSDSSWEQLLVSFAGATESNSKDVLKCQRDAYLQLSNLHKENQTQKPM